jgi:hypothetical protein
MEGSLVDSKMKWFPCVSVVCFACDPEQNGMNHMLGESSSSYKADDEEEVDVVNNNTSSNLVGKHTPPTGIIFSEVKKCIGQR